jgi:hypothetical protein
MEMIQSLKHRLKLVLQGMASKKTSLIVKNDISALQRKLGHGLENVTKHCVSKNEISVNTPQDMWNLEGVGGGKESRRVLKHLVGEVQQQSGGLTLCGEIKWGLRIENKDVLLQERCLRKNCNSRIHNDRNITARWWWWWWWLMMMMMMMTMTTTT